MGTHPAPATSTLGIGRRLRRWHGREDGSITIEAMLMLPLLIWCFIGTFVFYDAYRSQFTNSKASYTIGDILSRETGFVTPEYMDSLYNLQRFLVGRSDPIRLRLTVIRYDEDNDTYNVVWSQNRGGGGTLNSSGVNALRGFIPDMADGARAIIVQSSMSYSPIYEAGIGEMEFDDFVVTRPRWAGQLCWNSQNDSTSQTTATC